MTDNPAERAPLWDRARTRLGRLPVWALVPAAALTGALAGGAYGLVKPPQYTATSSVVAVPNGTTENAAARGGFRLMFEAMTLPII